MVINIDKISEKSVRTSVVVKTIDQLKSSHSDSPFNFAVLTA